MERYFIMNQTQILEKLSEILKELFDDDTLKVTRELKASDVEEWDSLMHVRLLIETESVFKVKLSLSQTLNFNKLGDLVDTIHSQLEK